MTTSSNTAGKFVFQTEYQEFPTFEIPISSELFLGISEWNGLMREHVEGTSSNARVILMVEFCDNLKEMIPEEIDLEEVVQFVERLVERSSAMLSNLPLQICEDIKINGVTKVQFLN